MEHHKLDLDYVLAEFGAIIINTNFCLCCMEEVEERILCLLHIEDEEYNTVFKSEHIGIPCCKPCSLIIKEADRQQILANTLFALENLDCEIIQ